MVHSWHWKCHHLDICFCILEIKIFFSLPNVQRLPASVLPDLFVQVYSAAI